jgi:hypothetical protein
LLHLACREVDGGVVLLAADTAPSPRYNDHPRSADTTPPPRSCSRCSDSLRLAAAWTAARRSAQRGYRISAHWLAALGLAPSGTASLDGNAATPATAAPRRLYAQAGHRPFAWQRMRAAGLRRWAYSSVGIFWCWAGSGSRRAELLPALMLGLLAGGIRVAGVERAWRGSVRRLLLLVAVSSVGSQIADAFLALRALTPRRSEISSGAGTSGPAAG